MKLYRVAHVSISKIALGTSYFGTGIDRSEAFALMDEYVRQGGNCLDTARLYGAWAGREGASEEIIGQWLRSRKQKVILSTKGGHPPLGRMSESRLSLAALQWDIEQSLKALGVEQIDLFWLHRDDPRLPVAEIEENVKALLRSGKVAAVGASNWRAQRLSQTQIFCASQIQWSLAQTTPQRLGDETLVCMNEEEYAHYLQKNMPVMAYSPQAKGYFSKAKEQMSEKTYRRYDTPQNQARRQRVRALAEKLGVSPAAVCLGYLLHDPVPAMAVVGCSSITQLKDSMTAKKLFLSTEDCRYLREG